MFYPDDVSAHARILEDVYFAPNKTVALTFIRALYFIQVMSMCKPHLTSFGQVVIGNSQYLNVFRFLSKYDSYN